MPPLCTKSTLSPVTSSIGQCVPCVTPQVPCAPLLTNLHCRPDVAWWVAWEIISSIHIYPMMCMMCIVLSGTSAPILLQPILSQISTSHDSYPWTLEFFMNITCRTACDAQDCETGDIIATTIGDFYGLFGRGYDNRWILRLKVCAVSRFHDLHLDLLYSSL